MAYTIVAESPGDIVITFTASGGEPHSIPLKSLTVQKSTDISKEYGTGYHQKYAHVQGKIDYEGDFEIGSWWVSSAENPKTWMDLIKENLTWKDVQGLSKEFEIMVNDVGSEYDRSLKEPFQSLSGFQVRCNSDVPPPNAESTISFNPYRVFKFVATG